MNIGYIGGLILNILVFILLLLIYTYIVKLENIGCACSEHPNKSFIKTFTLISVLFLLFTSFVSLHYVYENIGEAVAILFFILTMIFYVVFIVYIYLTFEYTRYLINEKCKCSEDWRREVIMIGTMIEFILFFVLLLTGIIIPVLIEAVISVLSKADSFRKDVKETIYNPIQSLNKVPSKLKKSVSRVSSFLKKSSRDLKKLSKK